MLRKRIKPVKGKFSPGDQLEITQDVGCIPAGVYCFEAKELDFLHFGIQNTAVFGIAESEIEHVKRVLDKWKKPLTTAGDFVRRYHALLAFNAEQNLMDSMPRTYCAVDPRALKHLSEGFEELNRVN